MPKLINQLNLQQQKMEIETKHLQMIVNVMIMTIQTTSLPRMFL
jgi:hypothetical protein